MKNMVKVKPAKMTAGSASGLGRLQKSAAVGGKGSSRVNRK